MSFDFTGQCVWVTGAGSGIGRAIAESFVARGARVIGIDIAFDHAQPGDAVGLVAEICDVASHEAVDALCERLLGQGDTPDVLVHAAGVLRLGGIADLSQQDWHACMSINAGGAFHFLRRLAPVFREQRAGAIIAIGSNAAHVPRVGMAAYGASKAALASLVRSVGLELAPCGVRCNLVSPGSTDTPMLRSMWNGADDGAARTVAGNPGQFRLGIPLGKLAEANDIAQAVLFLASPLAGHVTLQDLVIDGGATLGA